MTFLTTLHQTYLSLLLRPEVDAARFQNFTKEYASAENPAGLDRLYANLRQYFPEIVDQISSLFIQEMARLSRTVQGDASATLEQLRDALNRVQKKIPGYTAPPDGYQPPDDITKALQVRSQQLLSIFVEVQRLPEGAPIPPEAIDVKSEVMRLLDIQKKRRGQTVSHPETSPLLPLSLSCASRWPRMANPPIRQIPVYLYLTPHFFGSTEDQNWVIDHGEVAIKATSN